MREADKLIRTTENETAIVGIRNDGILHLCYKRDVELNKKALESLLMMVIEFTHPNKYPFVIELDDYVNFQDEGRQYMAEIDDLIPSTKTGLFLETIGYKMVAKHFIQNHKPRKEYQVFNNFTNAIHWLKS